MTAWMLGGAAVGYLVSGWTGAAVGIIVAGVLGLFWPFSVFALGLAILTSAAMAAIIVLLVWVSGKQDFSPAIQLFAVFLPINLGFVIYTMLDIDAGRGIAKVAAGTSAGAVFGLLLAIGIIPKGGEGMSYIGGLIGGALFGLILVGVWTLMENVGHAVCRFPYHAGRLFGRLIDLIRPHR